MSLFFFVARPNKRSPPPKHMVTKLEDTKIVPPPVPVPKRSWGAGSWGGRPPNPPTFYYITKELRLSSLFKKILFFFFKYSSPFIISRFGGVCQVFFKNFFKKIFHFSIDFCFLIWYNYYRN